MQSVKYARVQTNRSTLKKYIEVFKRLKDPDEELVAPRPLPGTMQMSYFALLRLKSGSENCKFFEQSEKCAFIKKPEYERLKNGLTYTWTV